MNINQSSSYGETARRIMRRLLLALAFGALLNTAVPARAVSSTLSRRDEPEDAELYQALLDLTNSWTVMCVAAHPDDEDGATLTVLRRKTGAHTVTVFSTNGEGGQNATGPELYEELGVIRERETREASAIQGSEPIFLGLRDFGYSKSADEAFSVWGHTEALRKMVLQIRQQRPDVIITNHDTSSGHGHHQATGRLAQEAFDAAADPARFPEQLGTGGVRIWQPQRLFVRVRSAGNNAAKEDAGRANSLVSIDANERDPVRGSTYAEQALRALQRHATQGPWPQTVPAGGVPLIRYRLERSSKQAAPLPSAARSVLDGLSLPAEVAAGLVLPTIDGRPLTNFVSQRDRLFETLNTAQHKGLFSSPPTNDHAPRYHMMNMRLNHALALLSGVKATLAPLNSTVIVRGEDPRQLLSISNDGTKTVEVRGVTFRISDESDWSMSAPVLLLPKASVTVLIDPTKSPLLQERFWAGEASPYTPRRSSGAPYSVDVNVTIDNVWVSVPVETRLVVVPPMEIIKSAPSTYVLTPANANQPATFSFRIINHLPRPFAGRVTANSPTDCAKDLCPDAILASKPVELAAGETRDVTMTFPLKPVNESSLKVSPLIPFNPLVYSIYFSALTGKAGWDERTIATSGMLRIGYSDARVAPNLRVGYVRSSDDTLRSALAALGVQAKELSVMDIRAGDLAGYDTIIIDNRGYQAHPELINANPRLLEYVRAGGTLVVFYHKTDEWNVDPSKGRPQLAPYPITLGNERVTDENAPVTFLDPQHPLLNFPNKLTQDDFKGWIQERGLYYPKKWDDRYSAPLASNDAGEQPLRGGLLAADYGRGRYVYTSMVWYRQLRAGVPGAYRMLANMLSYGHANRSAKSKLKRPAHKIHHRDTGDTEQAQIKGEH